MSKKSKKSEAGSKATGSTTTESKTTETGSLYNLKSTAPFFDFQPYILYANNCWHFDRTHMGIFALLKDIME